MHRGFLTVISNRRFILYQELLVNYCVCDCSFAALLLQGEMQKKLLVQGKQGQLLLYCSECSDGCGCKIAKFGTRIMVIIPKASCFTHSTELKIYVLCTQTYLKKLVN